MQWRGDHHNSNLGNVRFAVDSAASRTTIHLALRSNPEYHRGPAFAVTPLRELRTLHRMLRVRSPEGDQSRGTIPLVSPSGSSRPGSPAEWVPNRFAG